jgi:hypothetical protein
VVELWRSSQRLRLVVAVLVLALLTALAVARYAALWAAPQIGLTPAARTLAPAARAPSVVADRTPLPSCGTEDATTQHGPWNAAARACFWSAYLAGGPAEFQSTRLTVEGDPVLTIYRALEPHRVEVFVDSTLDRYGFPGWARFDCATLSLSGAADPKPDFGPDNSCVQSRLQ